MKRDQGRLKPLFKALRKAGWTIGYTGKSHLKLTSPTGVTVYGSSTPSCPHAFRHLLQDLKMLGGFHFG